MGTLRRISWVMPVLQLAACAQVPQYAVPPAGTTATVTFVNQTSQTAFVTHYAIASDCRQPHRLPYLEPRAEVPLPVAAGAEWAFSIGTSDEKQACIIAGSFRPEKDRSYRATLRSGSPGCILSLVELPSNTRVAFQAKVYSPPFASDGPFCVPL